MHTRLLSLCLSALLGVTVIACGDDDTGGGFGTITGVVTDHNNAPLSDVDCAWRDIATTTDATGAYTLNDVPAGQGAVNCTIDWFGIGGRTMEVKADEINNGDVQMHPVPMGTGTADLALASTHNSSFDWTTDLTSVVVIPTPTRAQLEKALYYQNPALYQDPSGETQITPNPLPTVANSSTFDFPIPTGAPNVGQQALDPATIVDSIGGTPLTASEQAADAIWEAAVEGYLLDWDIDATTDLFFAGLAVRDQRWGAASGGIAPQEIVNMYVHNASELWVKVVFQPFVAVAGTVTDSDGDGLPEVFGRVAAAHVGATAFAELNGNYIGLTGDTIEMRDILLHNMDELYSVSNPSVISPIGVSYEVPGTGRFDSPFAVVGHGDPASPSYVVNVLLVQ